jgi:hypothetical protein
MGTAKEMAAAPIACSGPDEAAVVGYTRTPGLLSTRGLMIGWSTMQV